jgi:Raf kinase inhibitor-like YbhB/YbcL family protein
MGGSGGSGGGGSAEFALASPVLESGPDCAPETRDNCAIFPVDNTMDGDNDSPELSWTAGPDGTQSYALILHDLVFMQQAGVPFAHWAIWNVPAATLSLPAMLERDAMPSEPAGAQQVSLSGDDGYAGPGGDCNVYEFIVFALGTPSFSPSNANDQTTVRDEFLESEDVLETATLRAKTGEAGCED